MSDRQPDDAGPSEPPTGPERGLDVRRTSRELPILLLLALVAALLIRAFVFQIFSIPSVSMRPTLERGDRVLVCEICGLVDDVDRGDVIVFEGPDDQDYIKRVAGLPGDRVELHQGTLFVNGVAVDEPYLAPNEDLDPYGPTLVPDGMLFVLGDNRARSGDSRFDPPAGVGLVPVDLVVGEALAIVWPPSRIGGV
ncbi:MAG TPA: signal peptidase I [Actinomycetota bacterium]